MKKQFIFIQTICIGLISIVNAKVETGRVHRSRREPSLLQSAQRISTASVSNSTTSKIPKRTPTPKKDIFDFEDGPAIFHTKLTAQEKKMVESEIETAIVRATMTVDEEIALAKKTPGIEFGIFSANVHLFPFVIHKLGSSYNDPSKMRVEGFKPNNPNMFSAARARSMGKALLDKRGENPFDVIVLQEAWDKKGRDAFFEEISGVYPYKMEDEYQSYLSYAGLDVVLGSGLAIYSRYPFEQVVGRDGQKNNHILETFVDYRGDECFAHKGFLLVKIRKNGVPVYVVATHLQAGASDVDRKYMAGASRESTRVVAKKEMEQIRIGVASAVMYDYYKADLDAIIKSCKIENDGFSGFLNKYIWNFGKKIKEKVVRNITGAQVATTDEQQEMACFTAAVEKFITDQPGFWQKAYIFLAGDFNIGAADDDYKDIEAVFGVNAQTIVKADEKGSTSYDNLATGTLKENQRIDHILSFGKTPITKLSSSINTSYLANIVGGSYISKVFDHTHSDHVALEALFKLEEPRN
jgi:endonuclease/exonuclease/phosphatase family metal-dependent hydrolase